MAPKAQKAGVAATVGHKLAVKAQQATSMLLNIILLNQSAIRQTGCIMPNGSLVCSYFYFFGHAVRNRFRTHPSLNSVRNTCADWGVVFANRNVD